MLRVRHGQRGFRFFGRRSPRDGVPSHRAIAITVVVRFSFVSLGCQCLAPATMHRPAPCTNSKANLACSQYVMLAMHLSRNAPEFSSASCLVHCAMQDHRVPDQPRACIKHRMRGSPSSPSTLHARMYPHPSQGTHPYYYYYAPWLRPRLRAVPLPAKPVAVTPVKPNVKPVSCTHWVSVARPSRARFL